MIKKVATIAACTLLLQAGAVLAENRAETVTFAPYVGGYTFQGSQHLETAPVFGFRLGYNFTENWALEGVIDYLKTKGTSNSGIGNVESLRYGGDVLYNFMPKNSLVPYLAVGVGGQKFTTGVNQDNRFIGNYGGGVKWFMTENVALRGDVRGLNYEFADKWKTNVEYTLGLHIAVGAPKPAPAPIVAPEPVVEAAAPKAAPVVVAPPPPPPVPTSTLTAEPASLEKGKTTTLTWSSTNTTGCEIQPAIGPVASSGSRVVTPAADTSYTLVCKGEGGSTTSAAGVRVTVPVIEASAKKASAVEAGKRLTLKVHFDTGKSVIKKQYYNELKEIGDGLNEHKELRGVIEGHTDSVGSDQSNLALSQRRAKAVRDYIVQNFKIDGKRLAARGYGESNPVADNATAEGRALNRRIEAVFENDPNFDPNAPEVEPVKPKKAVKKAPARKR